MAVTVVEFLLLGITLRTFLGPARVRVVRPVVFAPARCGDGFIETTVARSVADRWLADPIGALAGARVVPSLRDGRPQGFKLYAIRPGSPLAIAGFQNADRVTHIAGVEVAARGADLEIFPRLREAGSRGVIVDLERDGCPMRILLRLG